MKERRFSVHHVGQERRRHDGTGAEGWNRQCLGPRKGGLESLIRGEWQKLSIRRQCRKGK